MEIVLLLMIIVLIIYFKSDLNSKLNDLNRQSAEIARKLELLNKPASSENVAAAPIPRRAETPPTPAPQPVKTVEKPVAEYKPAYINPQPIAKAPPSTPQIPKKSWWQSFKEQNPDLEKFIGENLINKIGVLILVLGISYFVKYAIDKDWINETARAGIGLLCGVLVMAVAHKLRKKYAAFSSVLVAGAISIFYFTIAIAFHDYQLFSQTVAFILMVVITAFSSLISLSYNRMELAVLTLIGGFAVPFMVSTGAGNYIVLFSYIAVLNIGILTLAYYRKWNLVTILAYIFTAALYGAWLAEAILSDKLPHLGALLFGFIFYLIFILITIINNLRTRGEFSKIELTILATNTFLFYAAGMIILNDFHPEFRGVFTAGIAILNLAYASFLYKRFGLDKNAIYLLVGLTLTFITLAVPVQFEGNNITLFWAGEAVLLMWLAQKANFPSYRLGSVIVHLLMVISLIIDWKNIYSGSDPLPIVLNAAFLTSLVAVASLVAVIFILRTLTIPSITLGFFFDAQKYRRFLIVLAIVLGYFAGILEVNTQAFSLIDGHSSAAAVVILYHLLFSAVLVTFLNRSEESIARRAGALLAAINIVLFSFVFSRYAFIEHRESLESGVLQQMAFFLHYLSLLLTIYQGYLFYQVYRAHHNMFVLNPRIIVWIAAFFVVYIASSELMLHAQILSAEPLSASAIQAHDLAKSTTDPELARILVADQQISDTSDHVIKSGIPVLWGILAFLFLLTGIRRSNKTLRIIALTLLGLTILKLFLYDIRNVSETGKIIAFILLGVLILIISFVYQKIKVLVLDDTKKTGDE